MPTAVNGSNYLALPRNPQKWLIDQLIPSGGLANLYAKPKSAKSWAALDMSLAISTPTTSSWNGFAVMRHGAVLYLQIDTPREEWAGRYESLTAIGKDFSNVWVDDMLMLPTYPFNALDPINLKWLAQEVLDINPVLVVVDTLREAHAGDENDSTVMRNVMTQLVSTVLPVKAAMLFVSHQKKDSAFMKVGGDDLMDDARGSSYVSGRMDNVLRLTSNRLTWKGRSGKGDVAILQDEDTGLVVLDAAAQKEADTVMRVIKREKGLDPHVTKKDCAIALCRDLGWDVKKNHKTALRRIEPYFDPK